MSSILSASMLTAAAPEVDQGQSRLEPGNDSISKNVHASTETVQRAVICNQHGSPIASIKSGRSGALRPGNENIPPRRNLSPNDSKQRNRSCSTELNRSDDGCTKLAVSSSPINDPSFGSDLPVEAKEDENILKESISPHRGKSRQLERASGETLGSAASSNAVESAFRQAVSPPTGPHGLSNNGNIHITVTDVSAHPMKRLMSSLGLNRLDTTKSLTVRRARWSLDDDGDESSDDMSSLESCKKAGLESREKAKSSRRTGSRSSAGLGSTIKSLASNLRSGRLESDNSSSHPERPSLLKFRVSHRNSKSSSGENQDPSEGSYRIGQKLDAVAFSRCIRRWEIIQELVSSEQGYVNDLMVLTHVYLTVITSLPTSPQFKQGGGEENICQILRIHKNLLQHIETLAKRNCIYFKHANTVRRLPKHPQHGDPDSLHTPSGYGEVHVRSELRNDQHHVQIGCEANDAAKFAISFLETLSFFYSYQEYGANYESLSQSLLARWRAIATWEAYERGVEALINAILNQETPESHARRGLSFEDLLIKPIQRICRYPLLFSELQKQCSASEDHEAFTVIGLAVQRFSEIAQTTNDAVKNKEIQFKVMRTRRLHNLSRLPETYPNPLLQTALGLMHVCGVLYVAYHTTSGEIRGKYMLCALFSDYLIFACRNSSKNRFVIVAMISLRQMLVDSAQNGNGLQCGNALHSWKLIYKIAGRWHEVICCACTEGEERQWRAEISKRSGPELRRARYTMRIDFIESEMHILDQLPNYTEDAQPGTSIRSYASDRGSHEPPRIPITSCIIKNTHMLVKEATEEKRQHSASLSGTPSSYDLSAALVLAPERSERITIEQEMAAVWTREKLAYPAMAVTWSGQVLRTSASNVMRKLSKASIGSRSSIKTASAASIAETDQEDEQDNPFFDKESDSLKERASQLSLRNISLSPRKSQDTKDKPKDKARIVFDDVEPCGLRISTTSPLQMQSKARKESAQSALSLSVAAESTNSMPRRKSLGAKSLIRRCSNIWST